MELMTEFAVVDLSVVVDPTYPVVGLGSRIEVEVLSTQEGPGGWFTRWIGMEEHAGTHFDAPCHVIPPPDSSMEIASQWGLVTSDKVPLEDLIRPAAVVDCRPLLEEAPIGKSPIISVEYLTQWQKQSGPFQPSEAVLFYTSFNDQYYRPRGDGGELYYASRESPPRTIGWPAPNVAALEYLTSIGVRLVAIDAAAMGPTEGSYAEHVAGLGAGMCFVEKLCNFGRLPVRGSVFMFLPVKLQDGSGGFGRAIGLVPRASQVLGSSS